MSAVDVIAEFKQLPPVERAAVARFVLEQDDSWMPESFKISMAEISQFVGADNSPLARECAKLDRQAEQAMADEGLATEIASWPKY